MIEGLGKVAVLTGASKGMGRHFLTVLLDAGWRVAALARPSRELAAVRGDYGERVLAIDCDVASSEQMDAAVTRAVAHFGKVDLLINNAAVFFPFEIAGASDDAIEQHISVNLLGVIWACRAAIPHLKVTRGQIVTLSSESAVHPFPMLTVYAATKAAIETLSDGLRDELRADGIRVSVLRSGSVSGSSGGTNWDPAAKEEFYRKIVATGHAAMAGASADPESMAQALMAIVSLPNDVSPDMLVVRAAGAGMPANARRVAEAQSATDIS